MKISHGKIKRPQKVIFYGSEGIGKTSLAARCPKPLFIDTEGGTSHQDVDRVDGITTWNDLISTIKELEADPMDYKTVVIDTADWAERMAIDQILADNPKVGSIEGFGYGKGYTYVAEKISALCDECDKLIAAGVNVVITAHAKMRKFEQPDEQGAYDRWEMKLTRMSAPILKEWADHIFFLNYKTFVVQSGNAMEKAKAQGGKRVMYTTHHPCWDAKTRSDLPEELPLDFEQIKQIFGSQDSSQSELFKRVVEFAKKDGVSPDRVKRYAIDKGLEKEGVGISKFEVESLKDVINNWRTIKEEN